MPIPVTCPQCKSAFRVKDHLAGRRGKCPRCGGVIQVPEPNRQTGASGAAEPEAGGTSLGPGAGLYEALDHLERHPPAAAPGAAASPAATPGPGVWPGTTPPPGTPGPAAPYAAGGFPGAVPPRRQGVPAWAWIAGGVGVLVMLCLAGGIFLLNAARQTGLARREAERAWTEHGEPGTGATAQLGGEMVGEEEARAFAQKLFPVIEDSRRPQEQVHRLDPMFHLPGFMARTLQTRQMLQESDSRAKAIATLTVLTLGVFLHEMNGSNGAAVVRVQQRDGYRSLLLRTNDDDPGEIHYHDVLLVREQGQVKILDMYSYRLGMYLSTVTRWRLLFSLRVDEDTPVRIPADRQALIAKHQDALRNLLGFPFVSGYTSLRQDYESLPAEAKKWPIVQFGLLRAAAGDSAPEPFPPLASRFQKQFPDHSPLLLLASLKYHTYFRREAPGKVCQVLGELARTMDDPYLLLVQGRYALKKKLHDEALAGFQAALEQLERGEDQNQARIGMAQVYLAKKDFPRLLEMMTELRKHDRRPWNEIEDEINDVDPLEFFKFRRTDEYKQWKEQHASGSR